MKKDIKNWIFIIFRFLFLIILVYKPEKFDSISYAESIIFISFELFFILIFYIKKIYIKYLKTKMVKYLSFCFLLIRFFVILKKCT